MVERAHGAKVETRCVVQSGRGRGCKARFETIDSSTYREVQRRVQRTRAILAACSPVCASVYLLAQPPRPPPFSVIFFPTQNLCDSYSPQLIGGVLFSSFRTRKRSNENGIWTRSNMEEKGIFDEKFTRGTISRVILSRFVCEEKRRDNIIAKLNVCKLFFQLKI